MKAERYLLSAHFLSNIREVKKGLYKWKYGNWCKLVNSQGYKLATIEFNLEKYWQIWNSLLVEVIGTKYSACVFDHQELDLLSYEVPQS